MTKKSIELSDEAKDALREAGLLHAALARAAVESIIDDCGLDETNGVETFQAVRIAYGAVFTALFDDLQYIVREKGLKRTKLWALRIVRPCLLKLPADDDPEYKYPNDEINTVLDAMYDAVEEAGAEAN